MCMKKSMQKISFVKKVAIKKRKKFQNKMIGEDCG